MLLVNLALELFRDTVREFVVFFNPFPPFCVLDGNCRNTCRKQFDMYIKMLRNTELWDGNVNMLTNLRWYLPAFPPAGSQPSWFLQSLSIGPQVAPSYLEEEKFVYLLYS